MNVATGHIDDGDNARNVREIKHVIAAYRDNSSYTLTVNSAGAAAVTIAGSPGTYTGTTNYRKTDIDSGTSMTLTAPDSVGSANFSSWSGCTSTSGVDCMVSMTTDKTVTATYTTPNTYSLNVNATSAASIAITSNPSTYAGTTNYSKTGIDSGTSMTLTAPNTVGSANFSSWSGCTSTSGVDCMVSMTTDKTVTATYTTPNTYSLNVNATGAASIAITSDPTTYAGTTNYSKTGITPDISMTLTAPDSLGSANFSSWSGCTSTSGVDCTVSMTTDKTVTATYTTPNTYSLNVNATGAASIAITSDPTTYAGTTNYSKTGITPGTNITLTVPVIANGINFKGWSGDCSGTANSASLIIDDDKTCIAVFQKDFPWPIYLPAITTGQPALSSP